MNRVLVAGLGNEARGDDAAGLLAVRALRKLHPRGADVEEYSGDTTALAESMSRHSYVIVVDAVASRAPAGTVIALSPEEAATCAATSSHGLGLREALALAQALGGQPTVLVFGIAGREFQVGAPPSARVVRAAAELAVTIEEQLACA
jgi:hydrogenase maturation protease